MAGVAVLCAAGCGLGPVTVPRYDQVAGTEKECAELVAALPEVVADAVARDLRPERTGTAAWGQPAIVLRCGVGPPLEYRPDAQLFEVDGVAWLPVDGDGGWFFTTVDRVARVEVAVPGAYAPEADVLADLAGPIRATVPLSAAPSAE